MILTPIAPADLPSVLDRFAARLAGDALAAAAFARIVGAGVAADVYAPADSPADRAAAIALAEAFGIPTLDEEPAVSFSWDGRVLRVRSEPWVILHEIAHFLLCPPQRRALPDFGLGAGPETGRTAEADAARRIDEPARQDDEAQSSLLGILLQRGLGQPALPAFLEQNWLEGHDRPEAIAHFRKVVAALRRRGLIDEAARALRPQDVAVPA